MTTPAVEIDRLLPSEVGEAGAVLDAAFGRKGMTDNLRLVVALQPQSWFCARRAGSIVGLVGAYDYGPVASIGMMAVHPTAQRQRIGEKLMAELIGYLEGRGCPVMLLDASAAGQHLYPKLGFVSEGETLRMVRAPSVQGGSEIREAPPGIEVRRADEAADIDQIITFDASIFGANRAAVISSYAAASHSNMFVARLAGQVAGYLLARGAHIGPWAASSPAAAEALLQAGLRRLADNPVSLTCPGANRDGIALLGARGFAVTERLLHMRRGGVHDPRRPEHIYSQASLTLG